MKKLFISIPMHGKDPEIIKTELRQYLTWTQDIYEDEIQFIDSFTKDEGMNRVEMLGSSICLMGRADLILFSPNFLESPGCTIEYEVAKKYMADRIIPQTIRKMIFGGLLLKKGDTVES